MPNPVLGSMTICGNCAQGGDHFRKFGNRKAAEEFHGKCLSPRHCDCQHVIAEKDKVIQKEWCNDDS